jgi:small-conductance mechanosensitive channel
MKGKHIVALFALATSLLFSTGVSAQTPAPTPTATATTQPSTSIDLGQIINAQNVITILSLIAAIAVVVDKIRWTPAYEKAMDARLKEKDDLIEKLQKLDSVVIWNHAQAVKEALEQINSELKRENKEITQQRDELLDKLSVVKNVYESQQKELEQERQRVINEIKELNQKLQSNVKSSNIVDQLSDKFFKTTLPDSTWRAVVLSNSKYIEAVKTLDELVDEQIKLMGWRNPNSESTTSGDLSKGAEATGREGANNKPDDKPKE